MGYVREKLMITTERLVLRLFQTSDAETVTKLCNNYNIFKSTMNLPYPYSLNDALSWMERHYDHFTQDISYEFAVTDKETGELYGAIALSNNKHFNQGEIAYWIGEEYWGKGYATEAAQSIVNLLLKKRNCTKCLPDIFRRTQLQEK